ncbi:hypothetical protein FLAN108750_10215 [Flavobacterium antarcticum]|uniref:hypothetical protein n=1 Tax=Flavobacterium antarcticum TaxID=271155 RepID=UPI0003B70E19|nr:hypothetical protein [Flavobacterium antarcticum]
MKNLHISLYFIFIVTATIILLNRYTDFLLTDYRVHFFFLFFAASSFVIIVGHIFKKLRTTKSIILTFVIVGILCFIKAFFTWVGDWKTQTVLYQNIADKNKTVNVQMRADKFSFGYKKRVIAIYNIAPFMQWTTDIDTTTIDQSKWERVNLDLNEMNLPSENY